jgi:hypothetical protein
VNTVVCGPDDGWGYHPKHVKQFSDSNELCKVASCWIYIGIYLLLPYPRTLNISAVFLKWHSDALSNYLLALYGRLIATGEYWSAHTITDSTIKGLIVCIPTAVEAE